LSQFWIGTREPGLVCTRMHIGIKVFENIIVALQVVGLASNFFKPFWLYRAKKTNGIMSNFFPEIGIECAIESACFGMPTPPQIICQFIQSVDTGGHDGEDRHTAIYFHRLEFLSCHF